MPYIETVRNLLTPFSGSFNLGSSIGGTITTAGGYRIHTFSTVGNATFTPSGRGSVEYLLVAGGGGGGGGAGSAGGGGGGAGGYLTGTTPVLTTDYTVTVGNGGTGRTGKTAGTNGGDSSVFSITALFILGLLIL